MTREIAGLREIAGTVKGVLLDQFGVLHDGRAAFPGALEAVRRLRESGIRIAVLSNSGKTAPANARRLGTLGFDADLFDAVVTSGEVCRARLEDDLASGRLARHTRVLTIANGPEALPTADLPLTPTRSPADADLVLIAGREPDRNAFADELDLLRRAAARDVRCICANPDVRMYARSGSAPGPGALAAAYVEAGGQVEWIGKPHPAIFTAALARLQLAAADVLMIGDSPEHDIRGAADLGCRTLLVEGGVQSHQTAEAAADYVIPRLLW